jgi:error-prone DNA polymerase
MTNYIELRAHSIYSLLQGTSSPDALVGRAAELGMMHLALTDDNALYGATEFARAAQGSGITPIFGATLTLADGTHLPLLVQNETGWRNLCTLITTAQHNAPKGKAELRYRDLDGHAEGLIALTGGRHGAIGQALLHRDTGGAREVLEQLLPHFGPEHLYVELQHHLHRSDPYLIRQSVALARQFGLSYVATNNVYYPAHEGHRLSDILLCIRENITLEQARRKRRTNSEYYLKSAQDMGQLFAEVPEALTTSLAIAEQCTYTLPTGLQALPTYPVPEGENADSYLQWLCDQALTHRYDSTRARATEQLTHELGVIRRAGLSNYFLVVWDVMDYCREQGIMAQGRGSACNSIVAYLLGISPIDPIAHNLTFARFLSDERNTTPDIDIDIESGTRNDDSGIDPRDKVIQYVYERWGREHVAMACTFIRYGARSALRDLAKTLVIPQGLLKPISRLVEGRGVHALSNSEEVSALTENSQAWRLLQELAPQLAYLPRHLGLHNGGMVMSGTPLAQRVPTEPAAYPNRIVVQWDKDMLEDGGIIKLDLLGLKMLLMLCEAGRWIATHAGFPFDWSALTFDDPAVYDLIARGDTIGCFQVESRAQAQMLPRLKPRCFNDLIIAISLIRPGPIIGDMVHPFLRRRNGEEAVVYLHPALESVLGDTLGVLLWQEQLLEVTHALTGMTRGEGEQLRRALSKNSPALEGLTYKFWNGAKAKGISKEVTQAIWGQLKAFGGYSFPKSHAAAFAVPVYRSAWLKRYYPAAFYASLLNCQPMGFWSPSVILGDAKRHDITVLPVDINESDRFCTATTDTVRLGFNYIKGMGRAAAQRIVEARGSTPFRNLTDFCRRTQLPRRLIESLIIAGALDSIKGRRPLLWELGALDYDDARLPLEYAGDSVDLPPLNEIEAHFWEQEITSVTVGDHILTHYRIGLEAQGIITGAGLLTCRNGMTVQTAGQIVMHQAPPTAKGIHFVTLEDETGLINLVIKPDVYRQVQRMVRGHALLWVQGQVQRRDAVVSVLVQSVDVLDIKRTPVRG